MLLNCTSVIPRSRYPVEAALLQSKIDELNKNIAILIAQAEKLIQESERLSAQAKAANEAPIDLKA
jgi:outer membrane murein-binding lipoprotein Lpp